MGSEMSPQALPSVDTSTLEDIMVTVRPILEAADYLANVVEELGSQSGLNNSVWDALSRLREAQENAATSS